LKKLGNFWADFVRIDLYILLPLAIVLGLAFVALDIPQTLGTALARWCPPSVPPQHAGSTTPLQDPKPMGTNPPRTQRAVKRTSSPSSRNCLDTPSEKQIGF
jgi:hypothetical protein